MNNYHLIFSILSAVILFLYALQSFSSELKIAAGPRLKDLIKLSTKNRFISLITGAIVTVLLQSSAAVTSILITFIDSKLINFTSALAVILGAYIGTSITAILISYNISNIGPIFIVLGTLISFIPLKIKILGKALFFFGFIFFSLDLISNSLSPVKNNEEVLNILKNVSSSSVGFLVGIVLTILVQSSTVVTGLTIVFVEQGFILPEHSIPIIIGANLGTTSTALMVSMGLNKTAKKTALANTIMNIVGSLIAFIFLRKFTELVMFLTKDKGMIVAVSHLTYNVVLSLFFLILLKPFSRFMDKISFLK